MEKMKTSTAVLLLFIAELLGVVATIGIALTKVIPGLFLISIAAIASLVLSLIAYIKLKNNNGRFNQAFLCVIAELVLNVVVLIFSFIGGEVLSTISIVLTAIASVIEILEVITTIEGCMLLCEDMQNGNSLQFGRTTETVYTVGIIISVAITLLASFGAINGDQLTLIFALIELVVKLVGYVMFVIFLFKTYRSFKA